jgi:hypothetical protein
MQLPTAADASVSAAIGIFRGAACPAAEATAPTFLERVKGIEPSS